MNVNLTADTTDKTLMEGANAWTAPPMNYGESLTIGLNLMDNVNGGAVPSAITPTSVVAAVGVIDARPDVGEFAIQMGPGAQTDANTTARFAYNGSAAAMATAINALAGISAMYGTCTGRFSQGSFLFRFPGTVQPLFKVVDNTLFPVSFGRVSMALIDGQWHVELRLTQAPVAFTDVSATVLPPSPVVTEVQAGGSSGLQSWNEVQSIFIRPDFAGQFALQVSGSGQTALLSVADNPTTIQAALVAAYGANFTVTLGAPFCANVTFTGIYAGQAIALMNVLLVNPPVGATTFTLQFTSYALLALFRTSKVVTLPFQVRVTYLDTHGATQAADLITQGITINLGPIFPDLATIPQQLFLYPPSPKTYVPVSTGTTIVGQAYFTVIIGDAVHTIFAVAHGLDTDVVKVWVRVATTPGAQLVEGTDFTVEIDDANSVTVTAVAGAPALNAWMVIVESAQTVGAFAVGLNIDIGQVNGLQTILDSLNSAVAALQALVPGGNLVANATTGGTQTITIPDAYVIFPSKRLPAAFQASTLDNQGQTSTAALGLPRPPALLSAFNVSSVTTFTSASLPGSPTAGTVYQNTGSSPVYVPGFGGIASSYVQPAVSGAGGYVGYDGRGWYLLTNAAGKTTYFPTAFEQIIAQPVTFDAALWQSSQQFNWTFNLSVVTFRATSDCQWDLVIEIGTAPSDTSPATTAPNLEDVIWSATPLLTQRIVVTPLQQSWQFGAQILRASNDAMSALKLRQGTWSAADAAPGTPSFLLRARLVNFDTQDPDSANAVGFAWAHFSGSIATITN